MRDYSDWSSPEPDEFGGSGLDSDFSGFQFDSGSDAAFDTDYDTQWDSPSGSDWGASGGEDDWGSTPDWNSSGSGDDWGGTPDWEQSSRQNGLSGVSGWDKPHDPNWDVPTGSWGGSRRRRRKPLSNWLIPAAVLLVILCVWVNFGPGNTQDPVVTAPPPTVTQEPIIQVVVPTVPVVEPPAVTEPVATEDSLVPLPQGIPYYCRSLLSPWEQEIYDKIYSGLMNMTDITGIMNVSEEEITKLMVHVFTDHPEIFWVDYGWGGQIITHTDGTTERIVSPNYTHTRQQRDADQAIIDAYAYDCLQGLQGLGEYEQVKAVYDYIINNTTYDYDYYGQTILEIIANRRGVCASYARTTQYLLQQLGFECFTVAGTGHGESHRWTLVKVEGEYYQLDTTWGDPILDPGEEPQLNYHYFLITDQEMYRDHVVEQEFPLPSCTATSCNYFLREGRQFDWYDRDKFLNLMWLDVVNGQDTHLRCGNRQTYDAFLSVLSDGGKIYPMLESLGLSNIRTDSLYFSYNEDFLVITLKYTFQ